MPLRYDGPASAFFPVQVPVNLTNQNPWVVLVKFFPIQQNDIRIRGNLYVFRNLSGISIGEFFAYEQVRLFNDRVGHIVRWTSAPQDLVSVTTFYDFERIQIWTEGAGLA